jgi:putative transcriptional regulator
MALEKRDIEPAPGVLLVAGAAMADPNFARSVVLICAHEASGSFGLILNRPAERTLSQGVKGLVAWDAPLLRGGPVQAETLHFLHRVPELAGGAREVLPGVFWGGDFERLKERAALGLVQAADCRFFAGYAGWGEGQLQTEIERNDWYLAKGTAERIFVDRPAEHWGRIVCTLGREFQLLHYLPENAQLN